MVAAFSNLSNFNSDYSSRFQSFFFYQNIAGEFWRKVFDFTYTGNHKNCFFVLTARHLYSSTAKSTGYFDLFIDIRRGPSALEDSASTFFVTPHFHADSTFGHFLNKSYLKCFKIVFNENTVELWVSAITYDTPYMGWRFDLLLSPSTREGIDFSDVGTTINTYNYHIKETEDSHEPSGDIILMPSLDYTSSKLL